MYSDWEQRSSAAGAGAGGGLDVTGTDEENRRLALKEPLTGLTTGIISGALAREARDVCTELSTWDVPFVSKQTCECGNEAKINSLWPGHLRMFAWLLLTLLRRSLMCRRHDEQILRLWPLLGVSQWCGCLPSRIDKRGMQRSRFVDGADR